MCGHLAARKWNSIQNQIMFSWQKRFFRFTCLEKKTLLRVRLLRSRTVLRTVKYSLSIAILSFLPPEGEVLVRGVGLWLVVWNDSENVDLHRHIIYQNDPMAKPDFMVIDPDLYRRRRRRQARRRLPSLPPEPQGHLKNAFRVPKQLTNFANLLNTSSTNTF